jgi:hypothetical protein
MLTESFALILLSVVIVLGARVARACGLLQPVFAVQAKERPWAT